MIFSLDVRRARKGDCLLLHYGTKEDPGLVMIDGGPSRVYGPHLKPRLETIRAARGGGAPLDVDLLMISHVDDDHINGILELTSELREAADAQTPPLVNILGLWHNSFDNIIDGKGDELTGQVASQFGAASVSGGGELSDDAMAEIEEESAEDREVVMSGLMVLASIRQGAQLRTDAERLDLPINDEFEGELIIAKKNAPIDMGRGLRFTVVGPMLPEVEALRKKHNAWLKELEREGKSPSEVLAAYVDESVPNLSSLVLLAEAGGKTMLLTGDARGDKILEGLELTGLIEKGGALKVDVLKVPHHGSDNNLDDDFFTRIIAKHYVFSGDGEHGNPERASLEMLFDARGDRDYTIHLTYPIDEIDKGRKDDWNKMRNSEKRRKETKPSQKVRPAWSKKKQGLRAFFDAHNGLEDNVRVVDKQKAHVIDLLDPMTV